LNRQNDRSNERANRLNPQKSRSKRVEGPFVARPRNSP